MMIDALVILEGGAAHSEMQRTKQTGENLINPPATEEPSRRRLAPQSGWHPFWRSSRECKQCVSLVAILPHPMHQDRVIHATVPINLKQNI
jgi:hypothetical protein